MFQYIVISLYTNSFRLIHNFIKRRRTNKINSTNLIHYIYIHTIQSSTINNNWLIII